MAAHDIKNNTALEGSPRETGIAHWVGQDPGNTGQLRTAGLIEDQIGDVPGSEAV